MRSINGLTTVNGGKVEEFVNSKGVYLVEIMGKGYSSHPSNIVATYFKDANIKTSLVIWEDSRTKEARICVFKYKADNLEHYYSRDYDVNSLPEKYIKYAKNLLRAYSIQFNNGRMAFNYPRSWGLV